MTQINASIVLYHNKKEQLTKVINSFLNTDMKVKLYLVDNSSNDDLKELAKIDNRIKYIFNNANLGYGTAHNIAMKKSISDGVPYHLVLNPDIYFEGGAFFLYGTESRYRKYYPTNKIPRWRYSASLQTFTNTN